MGNAESSSWGGGGGHGEKEEVKREQEQQDTESDLQKALKLAAAAATTAVVAYGAYNTLRFHTEAEEEERMADPRMRERAGRSSSSGSIPEGAAAVAVWFRPPNGWVTLNTDFSGPSGMGIIIGDHLGKLLWCSAEQVEDCIITDDEGKPLALQVADCNSVDVDEGEALALLKGLQIARDQGYKKVIAETDHKSNFDSIDHVEYRASHFVKLIRQYKYSWFEKCYIKHIKREGNRCANHLAGLKKSIPFERLRDSGVLQKLIQEDKKKSFGLI